MAEETEVKEIAISDLSSAEYKEARKNGLEVVPKPEPKVEEHEEKPKEKGGFQVRIARLIKQGASKDETISKLERELQEARKGSKSEEKQAIQEPTGKPQEANFASKDEYIEALVEWTADQKIAKAEAAKAQAAAAAEHEERTRIYLEKLEEGRSLYDDFDEVGKQNISLPLSVEDVIRNEIDNPHLVIHFLGSNPEICEELMKMKPLKAAAEVWRISEKLDAANSEEEEETAAKAKAEEKPARKAPEPIKPIGNGRSRGTTPLNEMSMADYKRARAAGRIS